MDHKLWVGQRYRLNDRGHYTAEGGCGTEKVVVEIDPSVTFLLAEKGPERGLMNMRAQIQTAARQKWEADEAFPQARAPSGRVQPKVITLTADDLGL